MSGRTTSSALIWLVVGIGILLAGVMLGRVAGWLGQSSAVALVSYTIGALVALAAVGSAHAYRAALARRQTRARWERHQASKQRVRFIDPGQDS